MNRIKSIDIAKAFGIFLIVIGHTLRSGYLEYYIYSFHVPLFFLLSGLCWKNPISFKNLLVKKFKTIMIPYYNFAFISAIVYMFLSHFVLSKLMGNDEKLTILNSIWGIFYANSKTGNMDWNKPLWFLPCLFICNIIVYFVEQTCKQKKPYRYFCIVLLFVVNGLLTVYTPKLYLPFQIETAFGMTAFFEIGILLKNVYKEFENKVTKMHLGKLSLCVLIMQVIGISCILFNNNVRIDVRIDHYGNYLLYIIGALSLSIYIIMISCKITSIKLQYIGKHTLGILLMHKFPVIFLQAIIPGGSIVLTNPNSILGLTIAGLFALIAMGMCLIADYVINKYFSFLYKGIFWKG